MKGLKLAYPEQIVDCDVQDDIVVPIMRRDIGQYIPFEGADIRPLISLWTIFNASMKEIRAEKHRRDAVVIEKGL